jgi:hypothetical protein
MNVTQGRKSSQRHRPFRVGRSREEGRGTLASGYTTRTLKCLKRGDRVLRIDLQPLKRTNKIPQHNTHRHETVTKKLRATSGRMRIGRQTLAASRYPDRLSRGWRQVTGIERTVSDFFLSELVEHPLDSCVHSYPNMETVGSLRNPGAASGFQLRLMLR